MKLVTALLSLLLVTLSTAASAQSRDGITASLIGRELKTKGHAARIDEDPQGDPRVTTSLGGREVQIWFYKCSKGQATEERSCEEIQFFTRFETPKVLSLTTVNRWNEQQRFGKVYSYKDKSGRTFAHMEIDVVISGTGAPPAQLFGVYLDMMQNRVRRFEQDHMK